MTTTTTTTEVKERPILFTGQMVRAILDGRKTQTRRAIKSQPKGAHCCVLTSKGEALFFKGTTPESPSCDHGSIPKCPYGLPGDRLWVRETWAIADIYDKDSGNEGQMPFELNGSTRGISIWYLAGGEKAYKSATRGRWRPSIFMPRAASRITLEVTGVKVERLLDIGKEAIQAEGFQRVQYRGYTSRKLDDPEDFSDYWDHLNAKKYPWANNPWVWVIEFKKV